MSLGNNIKDKRKSLNISQEYVAEQLDVSRQAVSKWETNQSEPSTDNLIKLANVFDCDVNEIISPKRYSEERKNTEKTVADKVQKNIKMQLSAIFGRIFLLIGFLGVMGAYQTNTDPLPNIWWIGLFLIGVVLTFRSSNDYFNKQKATRKIIWFDLLFIFAFFLYGRLPFEKGTSALVISLFDIMIVTIMNSKFWIPVWRKP